MSGFVKADLEGQMDPDRADILWKASSVSVLKVHRRDLDFNGWIFCCQGFSEAARHSSSAGQSWVSSKEKSFNIHILIQYIWYQNIVTLWRRWQYIIEDVISLLYGNIFTIVKKWHFQLLFLMVESVYWILNGKIYRDLYWKKANVI